MTYAPIDDMETNLRSLGFRKIADSLGWSIGLGVLFVITGLLAFAVPVATSLALAYLLGALFLVSGVAQGVYAVRFVHEKGTVARFFLAALLVVSAIMILRNPIVGTAGITLTLAFYLFMSAVSRWLMADAIRPARGWVALFLSSVVSFVLGVALVITFPVTSLVVPGIFFAVDMIFSGAMVITASVVARRELRRAAAEVEHPRHVA